MTDNNEIPLLTDLIESGPEITLSDLGLDNDPSVVVDEPTSNQFASDGTSMEIDPILPVAGSSLDIDPALEQTVRRILDEHTELAWQEIRLAIQQHLNRS
jgi:hypothetical protein